MQYAELHCLSNFSFLRGASHPEELVKQAALLNYQAIAITDECSLCGVVRAHQEAKQHNINLMIGSEFKLQEGLHLILLAPDRLAYGELSTLISKARRKAEKGNYELKLKHIQRIIKKCLFIIIYDPQHPDLINQAQTLSQHYPSQTWLGINLTKGGFDSLHLAQGIALAKQLAITPVACGNIHMHRKQEKALQDTLTAIRLNTTLQKIGKQIYSNAEHYLKSQQALAEIYPQPLLNETIAIAKQCHFSLDELRYEYPEELVPQHFSAKDYLAQLVQQGAEERWPEGIPQSVSEILQKELTIIHELKYEYYFLTVYDIAQFARQEGILYQGRGSAANSAVCYCLFITEVNPAKSYLLFERFISKERNEPPDIDVDFEHNRREEVIQFIYKKYGRERAAIAATVITYRPKSALRDVGKALGLEISQIEHISQSFSWWDKKKQLLKRMAEAGIDIDNPIIQKLHYLLHRIQGFPRHLSQHVGGFIISKGPLAQLVPIENASMPDRTVIQWDKNDLEALGLMKIDVLGLGILTAIKKSFVMIEDCYQEKLTMSTLPAEDPLVYQMLQRGDSLGLFQVESRAQMAMLPRLKPKKFYDLVIQVAIVRPGPIQGDMVHPYLKRRNGLEPVEYANENIRSILDRTLGVPIFQEQVIKLAMVAAGFSGGEADQLRRAMARWKHTGELRPFQDKLTQGMLARGYDMDFAQRICQQIQGFGEYGFPESHAASFALLVYVTAWLKNYHPAIYCCALLNSQPMGFYSSSQLIQDIRRHGVQVHAVDVCDSQWEHSLKYQAPLNKNEQPHIQLGFKKIKGLSKNTTEKIISARQKSPFQNLTHLARAAQLNQSELDCLARAGALEKLVGNRYQARWQAQGIESPPPLFNQGSQPHITSNYHQEATPVQLPTPTEAHEMLEDYAYLGLSLRNHPMALLRPQQLQLKRCKTATQLTHIGHKRFVQVAGLVTGRQRPMTATGVIFLTLEDETGNINVVVWRDIAERQRQALLKARLLKVKGIVEREGSVIHVIAGHLQDCSALLGTLSIKSRDFH